MKTLDIQEITSILSHKRFPVNDEKELQQIIHSELKNFEVQREYRLNNSNIVDFYIDGIGIEVKVKAGAMAIYRQCERYCQFDQIKSLILITNRSMGFPKEINGKPCYVINLGKSWL